jgi:MerR family transcriptional regulator, repressor of the yfmOP operon
MEDWNPVDRQADETTQYFTVEDVTKDLGITARTLRYYEEIHLVLPAKRTKGGHRLYDTDGIRKLTYILRMKDNVGTTLEDIRKLMETEDVLDRLRSSYQGPTSDQEKITIVDEYVRLLTDTIGDVKEKIQRLQTLQASFEDRLTRAKTLQRDLEETHDR